MDHKAQQNEYRRLKTERKDRLAKEELARKKDLYRLSLQSSIFLSHDDLLKLINDRLGETEVQILNLNPVEGGWKINYLKKPRGVGEGDFGVE